MSRVTATPIRLLALLALAAPGLAAATTAAAALPKPRHERIKVPESIAGVELQMAIKRADRQWRRKGDCDFRGFQSCAYASRSRRKGSASIEAARHGRVSSIGIFAGRDGRGRYVFTGRLPRLETREGIGLGDRGSEVPKAYPKAIGAANRTGYLVAGRGHSYMTFQTLDKKHITAITLVDGKHQG